MITLLILTMANALLRRFMGGGIVPAAKYKLSLLRRYGSPVMCGLLLYSIWRDVRVIPITASAFLFKEFVGTGDMFAVLHGGFDGKVKYSILNRWIYWLSARLAGGDTVTLPMSPSLETEVSKHNALWGFWFATLRGLYKMVLSGGLAWVAGKWFLCVWGFLGLLDGVIYYIAGRAGYRLRINPVTVAEVISGSVFGLIQYFCVVYK